MTRKALLAVAISIAVLLISFAAWIILSRDEKPMSPLPVEKTAQDSITGLRLHFKEPLKQDNLAEPDKQDKFIFRLSSTNPAMLVSVRYEDGLRLISSLSKQDPIDLLLGNADKAFPGRYNDYKKLSERKFTVDDKKAAELIFTYKGPSGEVAKQRLLIIVKDENTAIYISAQAQENIFGEVSTKYFDSLFSSISFD